MTQYITTNVAALRGGLLTVREVAELWRIDEETVYRYIRKGALTVVRVGPTRRIRVRYETADAFMRESA